MIVEFDRSFDKSLAKLRNKSLFLKLIQIITDFESSKSILDLPNVRKLSGFENYYRIRIGDYRVGFELIETNTVRFIVIAHRKEIYNFFPK